MSRPSLPKAKSAGPVDWRSKRRHLLQVLAFGLGIASIQYAFVPAQPLLPPLVYSVLIASITWAVIDIGREFFPSSAETGWPRGAAGLLLVAAGIMTGYLLGTTLAHWLCNHYGWYPPSVKPGAGPHLRSTVLITALAGLTGSFYFYSVNQRAYLQRKMLEARQHASEARLKLLETQLEPHMLFNSLANLRVLIGSDPAQAQQMLDHMIAYLRATLSASRATTHTLACEFERLGDYLEVMAIRLGPRLQYSLNLPAELAGYPVPALLLQPLVENSVKHGLEPKVAGGSIRIDARQDGERLTLSVVDTGVGLSPDRPSSIEATDGFGLAQIRERLLAAYGSESAITLLANSAGGTCANITLPLKNER